MNSLELKQNQETRKKRKNNPKMLSFCPLVNKVNNDCDLLFFKQKMNELHMPCCSDGKCLGTPLRKMMYRKDNPKRKITEEQLKQVITAAITTLFFGSPN